MHIKLYDKIRLKDGRIATITDTIKQNEIDMILQ